MFAFDFDLKNFSNGPGQKISVVFSHAFIGVDLYYDITRLAFYFWNIPYRIFGLFVYRLR